MAATSLKERQQKAIDLDTKKQILSAVITLKEGDDALGIYNTRIEGIVIDKNGDIVKDAVAADKIDVRKESKVKDNERKYPVFIYKNKEGQVESYIVPTYGAGLWDAIWGFVALESDLNTIKGVSFGHKGETPGLGQRIDTKEIQNRYIGKKFFDDKGALVSIDMIKGETGTPEANAALGPHKVDGMSGATITGDGVDKMLTNYIDQYTNYFEKVRKQATSTSMPATTTTSLSDTLTQAVDSMTVAVDSSKVVIEETVATEN